MWIHKTAIVENHGSIGKGTRIWHWVHVMPGVIIGLDSAQVFNELNL